MIELSDLDKELDKEHDLCYDETYHKLNDECKTQLDEPGVKQLTLNFFVFGYNYAMRRNNAE